MANHISGGHLSYRCIGFNSYEIKMYMYKDCANSSLSFTPAASIAIYDGNGQFIRQATMWRGETMRFGEDLIDHPCAIAPPSICTDYAIYRDTIGLPPTPEGYTLSYQLCCRSPSISNVSGPQNYGSTFTIQVPPHDTLCNSSPQLNEIIPNVICVQGPLDRKLNISDPDGDSLVFELCNVFAGGGLTGSTTACPTLALVPSPACPPPYKPVPFNGTYTAQNPLPASAQLYLDPDSGHFHGMPSQIGQYILGICVKEYRDGVLLSTFLIDYQFHAVSCLVTRSDMLTPAEDPLMLCNGLTIDFLDQSVNASDLKWDFGDPSSTLDTSTSATPQYTYPVPGVYPVTLITEPNNPYCSDTLVVDFPVRERVVPAFIWDGNVCFEDNEVSFAPIGYYPSDVKFEWEFGPLANPSSAKSKNPPMVSWSQPGFYNVQFAVLYDSCRQQHSQVLEIKDLAQVLDAGPDQINLKPGQVAKLEASGAIRYYWYAENGTEFSSRITAETSVRMDSRDSLKVYVKGWSADGCSSIDSLYLIVPRNEAISGPINFFTPNDDGVNDVFNLAEFNLDNCAISILNRWGVEVWQEDAYKNDWTGLDFGGDELPDGTYYYILQCDKKVKLKAAVTLIRDTSKN